MRRRILLFSVIYIGVTFNSFACFAEFGRGKGNIEEATRTASARFNDGLSQFHLMLSAWDRKQRDEAAQRRGDAVKILTEASSFYAVAVKSADHHIIQPSPQTEQEQDDVSYFTKHAGQYGLKEPFYQDEILDAVVRAVQAFTARVRSPDLSKSLNDLRAQQSIANQAAELQQFLVSVTTVLTLG